MRLPHHIACTCLLVGASDLFGCCALRRRNGCKTGGCQSVCRKLGMCFVCADQLVTWSRSSQEMFAIQQGAPTLGAPLQAVTSGELIGGHSDLLKESAPANVADHRPVGSDASSILITRCQSVFSVSAPLSSTTCPAHVVIDPCFDGHRTEKQIISSVVWPMIGPVIEPPPLLTALVYVPVTVDPLTMKSAVEPY
jgi:hypothetical protein